MKMHLNLIAPMVFTSLTFFSATAQTCDKAKSDASSAQYQLTTPGGLLINAGGARRIVARMGMENKHSLRVQLANLQEYQVELSLVAPDGSTRWEQTVANKPGFSKMLDLKALTVETGTYVLYIHAGEASLSLELLAKANGVTLGLLRQGNSPNGSPAMAGK